MKTLTLKKKEALLNWNTKGWFDFNTKSLSVKNKRDEIRSEFSKIGNVDDLLEAFNNTSRFRSEMKVIEHGYATATGSNYDKMIIEFRGEKYVINDRKNSVQKYDGTNGFS